MTATVLPFPHYRRLPYVNRQITRALELDASASAENAALVVQRDDGQFGIGVGEDAPGPFPTRQFAEAVASRQCTAHG